MADDELKPSDHTYHGIASLRGWDSALSEARRWEGAYAWRIGRIISAVLLAGGDDRVPVAIAGNLDDNGTGALALLHEDVLVLVKAEELTANGGEVKVTLHSLAAIERVEVISRHSYYDGTDDNPRHSQIEVKATVDGREVTFPGRTYAPSPITGDASAGAALDILRKHLGGHVITS